MSAKQKFLMLRNQFDSMKENNEMEINLKMNFIKEHEISFSVLWPLFWWLFLGILFFVFTLFISWVNYSIRNKWRQEEHDRLWYKLENFKNNDNKQFS